MTVKVVAAIFSALFGVVLLLCYLSPPDFPVLLSSILSTSWTTRPTRVVPGGTGLKYCDDDLDSPETDLYTIYRLEMKPNPPIIGQDLTITAMGRVWEDISTNATTNYFLEKDSAIAFGSAKFCNLTDVYQTIDSMSQEVCPPIDAYALMRTDLTVPKHWPPGHYNLAVDIRNTSSDDAARLFCVEGHVLLRHSMSHRLWTALASVMPSRSKPGTTVDVDEKSAPEFMLELRR